MRAGRDDKDDGTGPPPPRSNPDLLGHEVAEATLRRLFQSGRMPHALLLSGQRGIGKATLAYRFARFVLAGGAGQGASPGLFASDHAGLAIPPDSGTFRRVASGGHADLLTVERAYDPRRRRLRSEIVVDDAREIAAFLRLTAAEGGNPEAIFHAAREIDDAAKRAQFLDRACQGDPLLRRERGVGDLEPVGALGLVGVLGFAAAAARDGHERGDQQRDQPRDRHGAREHTTGPKRGAPVELAADERMRVRRA